MKNLIYMHFINDRYNKIEKKMSTCDYPFSFLDEFGTSVALRANGFVPKDDEERDKVDEMYNVAKEYADEFENSPITLLSRLDDTYHSFIQRYYEIKWFLRGTLERLIRKKVC